MAWFIIAHLVSTVLEWIRIGRLSEPEKDMELLLLRQQLIMMERHLNKPVRPSRIEKLTLAVVTAKFKAITDQSSAQFTAVIRLFQPETVLKWHRDLVHGNVNRRPR